MNVNLDRRITIQSRSAAIDSGHGSEVVTWPTFKVVSAEWREELPSRNEDLRGGIEIARNRVRVRIRYLAGLDPSMRVVHQAVVYNIIGGPSEIGRKEWHEILLERYSS